MPSETQQRILQEVAESIAKHPETARLGDAAAIDHASTVLLVSAMREIAFPGFHPRAHTTDHPDAATFISERVPALRKSLVQCMSAAVRAATVDASTPHANSNFDAEMIADELLQCIPAIREKLAADVQAAYRGDPAAQSVAEVILCYPGIAALTAYRFAHELWNRQVPILPRMICELAHSSTGIDIHPGAVIGRGIFIDHGTGVVIGETCEIGAGCRIYQGVTLGAKKFERTADGSLRKGTKRHPTLGDRVTVYAGATILGGDTVIGDGSVVAGGVFVTQSVPPGHLVANQKAQVRVLPHGEDPS